MAGNGLNREFDDPTADSALAPSKTKRDPRPHFWVVVDGEMVYWPEVRHRIRLSYEDTNFCTCGRINEAPIHDRKGV